MKIKYSKKKILNALKNITIHSLQTKYANKKSVLEK